MLYVVSATAYFRSVSLLEYGLVAGGLVFLLTGCWLLWDTTPPALPGTERMQGDATLVEELVRLTLDGLSDDMMLPSYGAACFFYQTATIGVEKSDTVFTDRKTVKDALRTTFQRLLNMNVAETAPISRLVRGLDD
jgi:hypothetical protein